MNTLRLKLISLLALAALLALPAAAAALLGSPGPAVSTGLAIDGTSISTLFPGISTRVRFSVDNPAGHAQPLGTLTLTRVRACPAGDSWTTDACTHSGAEIKGCESFDVRATARPTSEFSMTPVPINQNVASGLGQHLAATGVLRMNDLPTSQDNCMNARLTLIFANEDR